MLKQLTVVLKSKTSVPEIVRAGGDTVAIRLPSHPVFQQVLTTIDEPLAAPSANRSNHISPTTALHVENDFPEDPFPIFPQQPKWLDHRSEKTGVARNPSQPEEG